jgi:hypothetical protein
VSESGNRQAAVARSADFARGLRPWSLVFLVLVNSGNACSHSVQNLLSSRLLSKNVNIRIYKTIILPVVLYQCETWSLT